ncbi:SAM-dependent methyltransferase [Ensifer adhaerens]
MSGLTASAAEQYASAVIAYYENTKFDYKAVWHSRDAAAFHFGYYDANVFSHNEALVNTNRVIATLAGIGQGDRVLDAGCGHGATGLWLAEHRGCNVVGISPVTTQVEEARRFAARSRFGDQLAFEVQSYTNTTFSQASFDVVVAIESICHAVVKASFYEEAARILRPGGRLVVAEYMHSGKPLEPLLQRRMKEWLDGWSIPGLETGEQHVKSAAAAGFSNLQVLNNNPAARRSLRRLYKLALVARPIDYCLSTLGFRNAIQHGNVVASLRQYQLLQKEVWFYGILTGTRE